ncbi:hypothetical protein [Paenibacillus sp. 481]|nr:hypothetical protein [Paenibacillus sp. 481]UHA71815.1 hypothetical protein KIK04_13700 [Paenibacillus sp. 481]
MMQLWTHVSLCPRGIYVLGDSNKFLKLLDSGFTVRNGVIVQHKAGFFLV